MDKIETQNSIPNPNLGNANTPPSPRKRVDASGLYPRNRTKMVPKKKCTRLQKHTPNCLLKVWLRLEQIGSVGVDEAERLGRQKIELRFLRLLRACRWQTPMFRTTQGPPIFSHKPPPRRTLRSAFSKLGVRTMYGRRSCAYRRCGAFC